MISNDYLIKKNPDAKTYESVTQQVRDNAGFCPCKLTKDDKTLCMCEEFRNAGSGFCHCGRYYKVGKFSTIALCGSTRFRAIFNQIAEDLTLEGYIVLMPNVYEHDEDDPYPLSNQDRQLLEDIHLAKIEMADAVLVINKNQYIGESTQREIEWAQSLGKTIYYWEEQVNGQET